MARTLFSRVLGYGAVFLITALYFVDFRSLRNPPAVSTLVREEDPGPAVTSWPHFRGPRYDAHSEETGVANSWPSEGPPVLWVREIGVGYSGFIAIGNRVYTQTQSLTEQKVLALDADSGHTVWEHRYDWPYDPGGMYPGPRSTPTWSEGKLFFASPDGLVGCLRADDGHLLWSVNINEKFGGRGTSFGYSCSPLVEEGKVILPVGGKSAAVVALDVATGATLWASGDAPASYCSALPITFHGQRQVVAYLQNEICGWDLASGRLLWRQPCSRGYDEHAACPLYDEPYLRTMQPFHAGSDLYRLEKAAAESGQEETKGCSLRLVRHDRQMSNDVASSVLVDGYLYGFDLKSVQTNRHRPSPGQFRCMNFKTGEIAWSSDRPGQATIVVAGGKLILFNDRGELLLARATPACYEELAKTEVFPGEICWTPPALHRGRLYLRSPTRAACIYLGEPERLGSRLRQNSLSTSTIAKDRTFELGWLLGGERECSFELPDQSELVRWYIASLLAILAAAVIAACSRAVLSLFGNPAKDTVGKLLFWTSALALGIVATPLGNRCSSHFVFTWPVTLLAVHHLAIAVVFRGRQRPGDAKTAWLAALGVACFALACLGYYDLTKRLSLAPAWYFLATFLVTWPVAVPVIRRSLRSGACLGDAVGFLLVFSAYFWLTGLLMIWRMAATS